VRTGRLSGTLSGGRNCSYRLNSSTAQNDDAIDSLFGDSGLDWFFADSLDQVSSISSEVVSG